MRKRYAGKGNTIQRVVCGILSIVAPEVLQPQRCARLVLHARIFEQARENTSPDKAHCDKNVPSWRHINCHTDGHGFH